MPDLGGQHGERGRPKGALPPTPDEIAADVAGVRRKLRRTRDEPPKVTPEPVVYRRDLPRSTPEAEPAALPTGPPVDLAEATDGVEIVSACGGRALLLERPVSGLEPPSARVGKRLQETLERQGSALRGRLSAVAAAADVTPEDLIFLDLETAGLASAPLFLIGTMVWRDGGFVVRQYFARDYSEERAVTSLFLEDACRRRLLISFNGKSFDLPFVRARAAALKVPCRVPLAHFDLLHESRRIWKDVLPDCKLQTLERAVCGRGRSRDMPGSEIPAAYHYYVRTRNAAQMVDVLDHNVHDLITLADLMVRLPLGEGGAA